ncbi:hypothetical protein RUND412_008830 [Rhizina undulata]
MTVLDPELVALRGMIAAVAMVVIEMAVHHAIIVTEAIAMDAVLAKYLRHMEMIVAEAETTTVDVTMSQPVPGDHAWVTATLRTSPERTMLQWGAVIVVMAVAMIVVTVEVMVTVMVMEPAGLGAEDLTIVEVAMEAEMAAEAAMEVDVVVADMGAIVVVTAETAADTTETVAMAETVVMVETAVDTTEAVAMDMGETVVEIAAAMVEIAAAMVEVVVVEVEADTEVMAVGVVPRFPLVLRSPRQCPSQLLSTPPVQGTRGQEIEVWANHFEVQSLPKIKVYQYDIRVTAPRSNDGSVDQDNVKECTPAMVARVMNIPEVAKMLGAGFVFDGVSIGWSTGKLTKDNKPSRSTFMLPSMHPGKEFKCHIDLKLVDDNFRLDSLIQFVARNQEVGRKSETLNLAYAIAANDDAQVHIALKFISSLLRIDPARRFVSGAGNKSTTFFDRGGSTTMPLKSTNNVLEAWRGFYQTAIIRFGKLTVNVDTATTAFIKPGMGLVYAIAGLMNVPPERLEAAYLQHRDQFMAAARKFSGCGFVTKHIKEGPKKDMVRRVFKFSEPGAGKSTFEFRKFEKDPDTGEDKASTYTVTIAEYFLRHYNISIRHLELPLVTSKKGDLFPLELCFVADAERWKETLQGAETADFIKFATAPGFMRKQQIEENIKKLHWHEVKELKEFGVSIKPQFMKLSARVLPAPIPEFRSGTDRNAPSTGRWNLRGKSFLHPQRVAGWGLVYFNGGHGRNVDENSLNKFVMNCGNTFRTYGISVDNPRGEYITANQQGDIERVIGELIAKIERSHKQRPNLILFLLSSQSTEPYATIKHICDTVFGVASQCMLADKSVFGKGQPQYLGNISLKVNIKLGGVNSVVQDDFFMSRRTMLIGCDASHPNPSQRRMNPPPPSFTALAGSYDSFCSRYTAVTSSQAAGTEIVNDFGGMAEELIKRYTEKMGDGPESIIYFRDGVSEGEYVQVLAGELDEIRGKTHAKITVVICAKRHHTRFFPTHGGDKNGNVLPGTVVENGHGKDIFLVAHPGLQGTVRPTHYAVLYDENDLSPDTFQRLCNNLCYGYGRATTAVSVVPPVYYAKQACDRARQHVRHSGDGHSQLVQVASKLKYSMS